MKSILKEMLQQYINGREEAAAVLLHDYIVSKTKSVSGLVEYSQEDVEAILASATEEELDEAIRGYTVTPYSGREDGTITSTDDMRRPEGAAERLALARKIKSARLRNRSPEAREAEDEKIVRGGEETAYDYKKRKESTALRTRGERSAFDKDSIIGKATDINGRARKFSVAKKVDF